MCRELIKIKSLISNKLSEAVVYGYLTLPNAAVNFVILSSIGIFP
jgi:hypothetical protein